MLNEPVNSGQSKYGVTMISRLPADGVLPEHAVAVMPADAVWLKNGKPDDCRLILHPSGFVMFWKLCRLSSVNQKKDMFRSHEGSKMRGSAKNNTLSNVIEDTDWIEISGMPAFRKSFSLPDMLSSEEMSARSMVSCILNMAPEEERASGSVTPISVSNSELPALKAYRKSAFICEIAVPGLLFQKQYMPNAFCPKSSVKDTPMYGKACAGAEKGVISGLSSEGANVRAPSVLLAKASEPKGSWFPSRTEICMREFFPYTVPVPEISCIKKCDGIV